MRKNHTAYILTGSNIGDRHQYLTAAKKAINEQAGKVKNASRIYQTAAWGLEDQPDFWNQALEIKTSLDPETLLKKLLEIELTLGRERLQKWGSRTIDIDILFYADRIIELPQLQIPHKHLHERNFTLIPLMEIAGEFVHPILKKTIEELYWASNDPLDVYLVNAL